MSFQEKMVTSPPEGKMNWDRNTQFLFGRASKRFLEILKEFTESIGVDSRFVERMSPPSGFANPRTFSDILASYPDPQVKLHIECLLGASKEVQSEIRQHFESNHENRRKALIYEMPTDKHMRLRLQVEYILRYLKGVDAVMSRLKAVGLLHDELLQAISHVRQLNLDREEITPQIQKVVEAEVAARVNEINKLRDEMESQRDELRGVAEQVKESKINAATVEEPQEDHWGTVNKLKQQQTDLNGRLIRLEDQVKDVANRVMPSQQSIEPIIRSLLEGLKEELTSSIQAQLDGAKEKANGHQEQIKPDLVVLNNHIEKAIEDASKEFFSAKSEFLAWVVIKEIDQVEQWIERALGQMSDLEELINYLTKKRKKDESAVTREFIELVERLHPKSNSRQRFKNK